MYIGAFYAIVRSSFNSQVKNSRTTTKQIFKGFICKYDQAKVTSIITRKSRDTLGPNVVQNALKNFKGKLLHS